MFFCFSEKRNFFHLGIAQPFSFNGIKVDIDVTPFSFVVTGLEQPGLVRKCDDCLIFSANECFMLSVLVDLLPGLDEADC